MDKRLPAHLLMCRLIPNVPEALAKALSLPEGDHAIGLVSADSDDVTYIALDEATKSADVRVPYARSLYAGAANASTPYAGEVIGVLSGPNPDEVRSGLDAVAEMIRTVSFHAANAEGTLPYLAHCVASSGSYLSKLANVEAGSALAYLIAPPVEALDGLDAALKAADVSLSAFFAPPSETNFAGGLLSGTQSACQAACDAFAARIREAAQAPLNGGSYGSRSGSTL